MSRIISEPTKTAGDAGGSRKHAFGLFPDRFRQLFLGRDFRLIRKINFGEVLRRLGDGLKLFTGPTPIGGRVRDGWAFGFIVP